MKPNEDLYCVIYLSRATNPMTDADLEALLSRSRWKNWISGVTGLLLYENGWFMQALEGCEEVVKELFQVISKDPRHAEVRVVVEDRLKHRLFPDWGMGFHRVDMAGGEPAWGFTSILERYEAGTMNEVDSAFVFHLLVLFKELAPPPGAAFSWRA